MAVLCGRTTIWAGEVLTPETGQPAANGST